jgi:hypothetical protein
MCRPIGASAQTCAGRLGNLRLHGLSGPWVSAGFFWLPPLAIARVHAVGCPQQMATRPPEFGEQTEEVFAEFGFSADDIAKLRLAKVV